MRLASLLLCAALSSSCAFAAPVTATALAADATTLDTPFTLQQSTQVPGKVLKPGGYSIVMKDHLSDRAIIQIKSDNGKVESTFLGVFHSGLQGTGATGPIALQTEKGHDALRGFTFPGGGTVEFVYPKAEAATLVTKSPEQVLAIDPASDNLKVKGNDLTREDAQIVTLWSLQATKVAAGQQGIAAKRYVAPESATPAPAVAKVQPTAPAAASAAQTSVAAARTVPVAHAAKRPAPAASKQVASSGRRPSLTALPHTASSMPLVLMIVFGSFASAMLVRVSRDRIDARQS